jgi:hypothetical protein
MAISSDTMNHRTSRQNDLMASTITTITARLSRLLWDIYFLPSATAWPGRDLRTTGHGARVVSAPIYTS